MAYLTRTGKTLLFGFACMAFWGCGLRRAAPPVSLPSAGSAASAVISAPGAQYTYQWLAARRTEHALTAVGGKPLPLPIGLPDAVRPAADYALVIMPASNPQWVAYGVFFHTTDEVAVKTWASKLEYHHPLPSKSYRLDPLGMSAREDPRAGVWRYHLRAESVVGPVDVDYVGGPMTGATNMPNPNNADAIALSAAINDPHNPVLNEPRLVELSVRFKTLPRRQSKSE